jgi:hypothetical protein
LALLVLLVRPRASCSRRQSAAASIATGLPLLRFSVGQARLLRRPLSPAHDTLSQPRPALIEWAPFAARDEDKGQPFGIEARRCAARGAAEDFSISR